MQEEIPVSHWADHTANELIEKHANKTKFTCASGISPSGVVHIGNFREAITVDLVTRALKDAGKEVRFLYSWDDYDALRKIPQNIPQEGLDKHLRKPLALIPDPFGTEKSYAGHFEKQFEKEIATLGLKPDFIYQNERYQTPYYWEGIKTALENEPQIREILNKHRTEPLPDNWSSVSIFCKDCGKDTTVLKEYQKPTTLLYTCKACKKDFKLDFKQEGGVKLLWRVDWPMRWAKENVDFEPGGKDHSSEGGSFDTGKLIINSVWKKEAPHYLQYDFVIAKGRGAKLSSSSGNLITISEALEVYEPQIIRWIFACRRPNTDFSIAFDLDVLKAYDDFDRTERIAFKKEEAEDKKYFYEKRIYELSLIEHKYDFSKMPAQYPFRHLCNVVQIYEGDFNKVHDYYKDSIHTEADKKRLQTRAHCAWNWVKDYAPDEFRFSLRETPSTVKSVYFAAIAEVIQLLSKPETKKLDEEALSKELWQIMKKNNIEPKLFFQEAYTILINKKSGPKLAPFLKIIGFEKAIELLTPSL